MLDYGMLVKKYIALRDKKAETAARHKAEINQYDSLLQQIERVFLIHMQEIGAQSIATENGTAYQKTQSSCTIADRDVFLNFIRNGDNWAFADIRANTPAVRAYLEANEELPPGVNLTSRLTVNVQR